MTTTQKKDEELDVALCLLQLERLRENWDAILTSAKEEKLSFYKFLSDLVLAWITT